MKRLFDILLSAFLLLILSIPLILLMWLVWLRLGSPIFFTQIRAGFHCKPFRMIKFRTMTNACGTDGRLLPDALRLTPFGSWLRNSSLDELPELWNILKGEMSFIGPRPLLMDYLPLYNFEQLRRHNVRPGLTGWAQINGRNAISWNDKFRLDVWYVDNQNPWLDLHIFLITVWKVIRREGIIAAGDATMPLFRGDNNA